MSIVKFNIGLAQNDGGNLEAGLALKKAIVYLGSYIEDLQSLKIETSKTERTLVCQVATHCSEDIVERVVYDLCSTLRQDCIAYRYNGDGYLVGPQASKWGPFDPAEFIE